MTKADNDDTRTLKDAHGTVADKVTGALTTAREAAGHAAHGTVAGIDANPLVALLGGLAIGAVAGALLPRGEKERELLAPVGHRVGGTARAAIQAARSAGVDALDEAGISQDNVRQQVSNLFEQLFKAAGAAGTAAVGAARDASAK